MILILILILILLRSSTLIVWYCWHCKRKLNVVFAAEPTSHIELKPRQTLCLFRWLKLSLNLERSFTSYTSCTEKTKFDFILINSKISPFNYFHECVFCKSGSRTFHISMQQGKKVTGEFRFCRLVLQDVFDLMIWCCGSSYWQNLRRLSNSLKNGHILLCSKKVIFDTIFYSRVI